MRFLIPNLFLVISLLMFQNLFGQDALPRNWHLLDKSLDGLNGTSTEKAYKELLAGKKAKTIVVAILDSGVEPDHDDLKDVMWTNPKEIPGNGIDDDKNGYIDDIHGWNFIGGKNGNVANDTYEATRLYAQLRYKYEQADRTKLTGKQKKEYDQFIKLKTDTESRQKSAQTNLDYIQHTEKLILGLLDTLSNALGEQALNLENINNIDEKDSKSLSMSIAMTKQILAENSNFKNVAELKSFLVNDFEEGKKHYTNELKYAFNPDYNPRTIIGDNYDNVNERIYGNNDVEGPDASHGTHVAGLVAAKRENGIGIDGVADHVRIMSVRCVPDGDERDKDVANAIRYAVDNGASIINMSFGKGHSPDKETVDAAVKYAKDHDVLLVHASGNSAENNDKVANFPNKYFAKKKFLGCNKASNWLEVGALSFEGAPKSIAGFSNYGKKSVDLFSPGVQIYSTVPDNKYKNEQGTSMASPIAAGVAALIRSYFPELTAKQVRKILLESAVKETSKVTVPGIKTDAKLSDISVSGGMINSYEAVKLASKTKGKKKLKNSERFDPEGGIQNPSQPRT
ncbi:MAG: S8 family peptidase [Saprospiraceae bacterium]|nr:S8 family peptidase [Saprospiraceae bacterium]